MPDSHRSVVVLRSVKHDPVAEAVRQFLVACDWERWLTRGATVVIKPNLCTAVPEKVLGGSTSVGS